MPCFSSFPKHDMWKIRNVTVADLHHVVEQVENSEPLL